MPKRFLPLAAALAFAAAGASAQMPNPVDIANLQEDVRGLNQRLNDLTLRVEQLERQSTTAAANQGTAQVYATIAQLNSAVADMNRRIEVAIASSQSETMDQVDLELEKLTKQVNTALAAVGKSSGPSNFSDDYPKTGISYTVEKGDTLALIAKKTGAKVQDIVNANKLSDPSRIQAGQVLFVPGAK